MGSANFFIFPFRHALNNAKNFNYYVMKQFLRDGQTVLLKQNLYS